jgi:hypothetical protein
MRLGLNSTPEKFANDLEVQDAGYYAERKLFCRGLRIGEFGLQIFASCKSLCKWFPGKATMKNCKIGTYDHSMKRWTVLGTDYVNNASELGQYTPMDRDDFEILKTMPGEISILLGVLMRILMILDEPPGNIHIICHCIWELDDDDDDSTIQ